MALQGNYIDVIVLVILLWYAIEGIKRGFWVLIGDLVSFLGSFFLAFRFYPFASKL